jgi:pyruvate dehydrogenase E2 component (dihydrolipoamide acetyltransferase)
VTVDRQVNAEPLFAAVEAAAVSGHNVSMTDVLLRAVSETLSAHPAFNATFEDDVHTIYEERNVGVAVDVDKGLLTPVIPDVGAKTVDEIAAVREDLTDRALSGAYTGDDLSGGTFTVSNLGAFGVTSFTPVINPPEVAILGVGAVEEKPVRGDRGGVAWRRHVGFSLSFDHRVVDGADAARFLDTLADELADAVALVP